MGSHGIFFTAALWKFPAVGRLPVQLRAGAAARPVMDASGIILAAICLCCGILFEIFAAKKFSEANRDRRKFLLVAIACIVLDDASPR